jgi:phage-related protein
MPGSVQNAAPTAVMPLSLSRAFAHVREYPVYVNEYANGESQRSRVADASRRRWRLGKRLSPAQLSALRDFYDARGGPQEAFLFYDPYETDPLFSYDPTGAASQGRHTVRFEGAWSQETAIARSDLQIEIVELA